MVIVKEGLQLGFSGFLISRMFASSGVRPLFRLLHRIQAVTMLVQVFFPPLAIGTT